PAARRQDEGHDESGQARGERGQGGGERGQARGELETRGPRPERRRADRIREVPAPPATAACFEEERFIFPETYGVNRVRLLVKDPHWLFAHWDVDPRVREKLRGEKGERIAALARLTLRLTDDHGGIGGAIVLPEGARSWYLRAVPGHRSYRVELGITLPSGEYRGLTRSNAVSTPRLGPSPEKATRRASYRLAAKNPPLSAAGPASA